MNTTQRQSRTIQVGNRLAKWASGWFALWLFCTAATLQAQPWTPSDQLLDLVRAIESSDGKFTVGDQGNSLGAYQMSKGAWSDVSEWRRRHNLATFEYETSVWNEIVSRSYASNYLQILHGRLAKRLNYPPSAGEVYAAYNMGFAAFARCQFSFGKVNAMTATNCRRINAALGEEASTPILSPSITLAAR